MSSPADPARRGAGRIAGFGPRFLAFVVDAVIANLIALLVLGGYHRDGRQNAVILTSFLLIELLFVPMAGQTPGMRVVGIGVLRKDREGRLGFGWAILRTALLAVVIPAVVTDAEGLGMHDRAAGSVIIHTR